MNHKGFLAVLEEGQGRGDAVAAAGRADQDEAVWGAPLFYFPHYFQ